MRERKRDRETETDRQADRVRDNEHTFITLSNVCRLAAILSGDGNGGRNLVGG